MDKNYSLKHPSESTNYAYHIYTPSGEFLVSIDTYSKALDVLYELNNLLLYKHNYDKLMQTIKDISQNK